MARNRRWMAGARKADSKWEGKLRDTIFTKWVHQADKISYTTPHTYTPDFEFSNIVLETKGRFREPAEASKYKYVREALDGTGRELVFVFQKPETPMPYAKKRKDGTKQTHGEWASKNGFRWYTQETVAELFEELKIEYPKTALQEADEKVQNAKRSRKKSR